MTTLKEIAQSVLMAAEVAALEDKMKILKEKFTLLAPTFKALKGKNKQEEIRDVWKALTKADPTPTKSYLQWIIIKGISAWKGKQIHFLLEDIPKIADSIDLYNTLKTKNKLKPEHKDINRIANYDDLFAITMSYPDTDSVGDLKKKEEQTFYDNKGAVLILNTSELKIVVPKTKAASQFFGKNTQWCTSAKNDNQFTYYNKKGPLYIILHKPTNKRWQFHFQEHQYMDEKDHDIDQLKFRKLPFFPDLVKVFAPIVGKIDLKYIDAFSYSLLENPSDAATLKMVKHVDPQPSDFAAILANWKEYPPSPAFLKKCLTFKAFKAYYNVHVTKDTSPDAKMAYTKDFSSRIGLKKYTFTEDQYIKLMSISPNQVIANLKIPITEKLFYSWIKDNTYAYRTLIRIIDGHVTLGPKPPRGANAGSRSSAVVKAVEPFVTPKTFPDIYKALKNDREKKSLLVTCLDNPDYYKFASDVILGYSTSEQVKMIKSIYDYRDDSHVVEGGTAGDKLVFEIIKKNKVALSIPEALNLARRSPSLFLQLPSIAQAIIDKYIANLTSKGTSKMNRYSIANIQDFIQDYPEILSMVKIPDSGWEKITQRTITLFFEEAVNHSPKAALRKEDNQLITSLRVLLRQNPSKGMDLINKEVDNIMHSEFSFGAIDEASELADWLVKSPWIKAMGLKIQMKNTYLDEFVSSAGFLNDRHTSSRDKKRFQNMINENKGVALKVAQFVGFDDSIDPVVP